MFMLPENVVSVLVNGENLESVVFKCAIHYSELGHGVWIYSPKQIKQLPENINICDKQVLKLLTFFYLKDLPELLTHLNGVHLWHKTPKLTIVTGFEEYCNLLSPNYNPFNSALITANLYDSVKVFSNVQNNDKSYLLIVCNVPSDLLSRLQSLVNLYFSSMYNYTNDTDTLNYIFQEFQDNKL